MFYITPVTFNDAASVSILPSVTYLPNPVDIYFGTQSNPTDFQFRFIFNAFTGAAYNTYLKGIPKLKYYFNLEELNRQFQIPKNILESCNFQEQYYFLLDIYNISIRSKDEFSEKSRCFQSNYGQILSKFTENFHEYTTSTFGELYEIKKAIEKIQTRTEKSSIPDAKFTVGQIVQDDNGLTIFQHLVQTFMNYLPTLSNNCEKIKLVSDLIINIMAPFLNGDWDKTLCKISQFPTSATFNIGSKAAPKAAPTKRPRTRGGSNEASNVGIPFSQIFGPYGFYQTIDEYGHFVLHPINTPEEQQAVWQMYGVNVVSGSQPQQGVAKGPVSRDLIQEYKQLRAERGLSNKPVPPRPIQSKLTPFKGRTMTLQELRQRTPTQDDSNVQYVTSSTGTQRVPSGGKFTKKHRTPKKKVVRKSYRKKSKRGIRRTTRKRI
jgi:hypothetical protein